MPPKPVVVDPVLGPLTLDRLARDVWVYQRSKGHRFSADDVATAFVAYEAAPSARRVLDLGCGLGSVLLLLASRLPDAELVGVEAQAQSFELLSRNVAHNALGGRVAIVHGDLRDVSPEGPFDLVTGTPPYFPPGHALDAADEQRTYARIEHRGGVEAYVHAAARVLAGEGTLVLCGEARAEPRVSTAAGEVGLSLVARTDIVARAGKPPLFAVWTLRRAPAPERRDTVLVLRDAEGNRTEDAARLRAFSGVLGPAPNKGSCAPQSSRANGRPRRLRSSNYGSSPAVLAPRAPVLASVLRRSPLPLFGAGPTSPGEGRSGRAGSRTGPSSDTSCSPASCRPRMQGP